MTEQTNQTNLPKINVYVLVDKKTGKVTYRDITSRQEARLLKEKGEYIVKLAPVGVVR